MKPLPHNYDVQLTGGPSGYALLSTPGVPDLRTAPPADFDGPGDAWSPEHLLLAAVQTCFLFTLRSIARASHADFSQPCPGRRGHRGSAGGCHPLHGDRAASAARNRPGTDRERALRMLEKSEKHCLVSASLSTPIRVEPEITES